ncbi:MAG: DUF6941 family protein [Candidatus Sumerlaeia bacterium]
MDYSKPVCLGIVLCDQVIEDKRTNKKSFIGVFNDIMANRMPAKHPHLCLVLSLTNCLGRQEFEICISREKDFGEEKIVDIRGGLQSKSPVSIIDIVFEMRDLPLSGFGKHVVEVFALPDRDKVGERAFFVQEYRRPEKPDSKPAE